MMKLKQFLSSIFNLHNTIFAVVLVIFFSSFSLLYNSIVNEKFKDKCLNTQALMNIYATQTEQTIVSHKEYYDNNAFYELRLMSFMEIFNVLDDRYSAIFDSSLNLLSKNVQQNGSNKAERKELFNPKLSSDFLEAVKSFDYTVKMVEVNWEISRNKTRKMYVFYRWIPLIESVPSEDRYLLVTAMSKESIINDYSLQVMQTLLGTFIGFFFISMYYVTLDLKRKNDITKFLRDISKEKRSA